MTHPFADAALEILGSRKDWVKSGEPGEVYDQEFKDLVHSFRQQHLAGAFTEDRESRRPGVPSFQEFLNSTYRTRPRASETTDTISPLVREGEPNSPITDFFLNTKGQLRDGDYIGAFNGFLAALTEIGQGKHVSPKGGATWGITPLRPLGRAGMSVPEGPRLSSIGWHLNEVASGRMSPETVGTRVERNARYQNRTPKKGQGWMAERAEAERAAREELTPRDIVKAHLSSKSGIPITSADVLPKVFGILQDFVEKKDTTHARSLVDLTRLMINNLDSFSPDEVAFAKLARGPNFPGMKNPPKNPDAVSVRNLLINIVKNPDIELPPTWIRKILESGDKFAPMQAALVRRADFPKDLYPVALNSNPKVTEALIKAKPDIPESALVAALSATDVSPYLEEAVARSKTKLTDKVFDILSKSDNGYVGTYLAKRKDLTADQMRVLAGSASSYTAFNLAKREDLPTDIAKRLGTNWNDSYVLRALVQRKDLDPEVTKSIVSRVVSQGLAGTVPDMTGKVIGGLLAGGDVSESVIESLLANPRTLESVSTSDMTWFARRSYDPKTKGKVLGTYLSAAPDAVYNLRDDGDPLTKWLSTQAGYAVTDSRTDSTRRQDAKDSRKAFFSSLADTLATADTRLPRAANEPLVRMLNETGLANVVIGSKDTTSKSIARRLLSDEYISPDSFNISKVIDSVLTSPSMTRSDVRSITAAALIKERQIRERIGAEIRPGDSSSKLGWFRDDDVKALSRPVMQTNSPDTDPVVMWMHPGLGKSYQASVDGNLVDFDYIRHQFLKDTVRSMGYEDYGNKAPDGSPFNKLEWRRAHPGVIEAADSKLLDLIKNNPEARGRIILTSVLSHLKDRPEDMSVIVDTPADLAISRIVDRDHGTREDATNWKADIDAVMSTVKDRFPERYLSTDKQLSNLMADESFESLIGNLKLPVSIVDTGVLGTGGTFVSGTSGNLRYTLARPSFQSRFDDSKYDHEARIFYDLNKLAKTRNALTLHDDDSGTGALKWEIGERNLYKLPHDLYSSGSTARSSRTSNYDLARLAMLRPEDARNLSQSLAREAFGPLVRGLQGSLAGADPLHNLLGFIPGDRRISEKTGKLVAVPPMVRVPSWVPTVNRPADDNKHGIAQSVGGASPVDKFKAMVALRSLSEASSALNAKKGPLDDPWPSEIPDLMSYPTDVVHDASRRSLPTTEFKTRGLNFQGHNEAISSIVVPETYPDTPVGKFIQRKYPHIRLIPSGDESKDFSQSSGREMMETREDAKGGQAAEKSQSHRESTAPTDEQIREALEFLQIFREREAGRATPQEMAWLDRLEKLVEAATKTLPAKSRRTEEPTAAAAEPEVALADELGGETEEEAMARLDESAPDVASVQDDTSTPEEREQFLKERGMDTSLAETGSMEQLVRMHSEANGGAAEPAQQQPAEQANANLTAQPAEQANANPAAQPAQPRAVAPNARLPDPTAAEMAEMDKKVGSQNSGLVVSGSRKNTFTYNGRRITSREAKRLKLI